MILNDYIILGLGFVVAVVHLSARVFCPPYVIIVNDNSYYALYAGIASSSILVVLINNKVRIMQAQYNGRITAMIAIRNYFKNYINALTGLNAKVPTQKYVEAANNVRESMW